MIVEDMRDPRHVARIFTGNLAYAVAAALRLGFKTREIDVAAEGGAPRRGRFFEVHIANGRYCGGGVSFAPDASLEDGLLDLVAIDDLSLFRLAPVLAAIQAARLRPGPGVSSTRAARITIRDAEPFPISADGETYRVSGGALEIEALPGAIDVLAP
jgi:diacylglycerol kinase family enzyme